MDIISLSIEEVKKELRDKGTKLVFVLGKTCTGKSTFAREISKMDYFHLEMDCVVLESVADKFNIKNRDEAFLVYKGIAPFEWQESFEEAAKNLILKYIDKRKVVVDAAFADPNVLKRIIPNRFNDGYSLIYFHPFNREFYYEGIFNRFAEDVNTEKKSFPIWLEVTPEIIKDYKKNGRKGSKIFSLVKKYGDESADSSLERFELFWKVFPKIILTGH